MSAIIYTKDDCPYCVWAKGLMNQHKIEFTEVEINKDMTKEDFVYLFPDQKTVPLIFINEERIGGYNELRQKLLGSTESNSKN